MSKVKITGNASGTGTLTIAAPNTNTDRTLTLPDADITLGGGVDGVDSDYTSGTAVKIDSSGNVGIGTSSPSDLLHVYGGSLRLQGLADGAYAKAYASGGDLYLEADAGNNGGASKTVFSVDGTERMRIDTSGNLKFNSGYGSVATAYGCRAWVNFNGTGTLSIRGSGNVSSVTDDGTGQYIMNFSTAMPDANYCPATGLSQHNPPDDFDMRFHVFARTLSTSSLSLLCAQVQNGLSLTDSEQALVAIFR